MTTPPPGGAFLVTPVASSQITAPEGFTEDQRLYFKTAVQFSKEKAMAQAQRIEGKDNALLRELLLEAGGLGLLMVDIPEAFGGLAGDKTTAMLIAEACGAFPSWSVTVAAHTGIGSLPIVWFGNKEQHAKYLPKLATGEWVAAYALTETGSGSDALGAATKAVKSADGQHWILNGSKQFITNAAFADVFIVFAKVDGEKFTGFIVDRDTPGFAIGAEEHKMGLRGSSTCPLIFEDAKVPVGNLLGEIGKGHKIAFNILNLGRLKMAPGLVGGMKHQIANAWAYAQDRKQFKTPIGRFPLIREKLARMAALTYAIETMSYRTSGLVDARLHDADRAADDYGQKTMEAMEQYAIEASILKVTSSEALGVVVDEAVQIHGGYGYVEEFEVERAYRDQRINRIFEGTNEINRMLVPGMMLKRAMKGELPLLDAAGKLEVELGAGLPTVASYPGPMAMEIAATERLKRLALYAIKVAVETFGAEVDQRQEVTALLSDVIMDCYALDSMIARTLQASPQASAEPLRAAMTRHFLLEAVPRSHDRARRALLSCAKGDGLAKHLRAIDAIVLYPLLDPTELRETIVSAMERPGGYPLDYA